MAADVPNLSPAVDERNGASESEEPPFHFETSVSGRILVSHALRSHAEHLFTTRQLQFRDGSLEEDYRRLAAAFSCDSDSVVRVRQVHGRTVFVVRPGEPLTSVPDADGIVSTDPDRVISIRVADCVPILIADRRGRAVAAVHAGWRGTAAGITGAAVEALASLGVPASDLVAAVGPSIGPCCYQVDVTVRHAFESAHASEWFAPDGPDHWRLNLAEANRYQLIAGGLAETSVSVAGECTSHRADDWFSYRRDGSGTGRMVAAIRLRPAELRERRIEPPFDPL